MTKREYQHARKLKYIDINESGNFNTWNPVHIRELNEAEFNADLGQKVLFEDDYIRVWEILLLPAERMPFRRIQSDFCWVSGTEGMVISRYEDGKIILLHIEKGDSEFLRHKNDPTIYDLENIGDNIMFFQITEFKGEHALSRKTMEVTVKRKSNS